MAGRHRSGESCDGREHTPAAARAEALREQITRAVVDQLCRAEIDWASVDHLTSPMLRIEATLHDGSGSRPQRKTSPGAILSHVIDLTGVIGTPRLTTPSEVVEIAGTVGAVQATEMPACGTIVPVSPRDSPPDNPVDVETGESPTHSSVNGPDDGREHESDDNGQDNNPRKAISGLRPSRGPAQVIEDSNTQRHMQVGDRSFPKRRKIEPVGYALKPSTLDKLVDGIWEQIHGNTMIDPVDLLGNFMTTPLIDQDPDLATSSSSNHSLAMTSTVGGRDALDAPQRQSFSHNNVFCRKVTQASRTCRSIEVIVQARWIEHFDEHIDESKASNPVMSETKHRKAALVEACNDFGWSEKELRNKMAVWRGYKELKDAGGWAALVFAGMGIYRFCKYRIGFDKDSLQRLRNLRPALEVAADTIHTNWRQLLALVGQSTERLYTGHRHDWVVFPDGSDPLPLHSTYLQWDPYFSFKHIDESVVDESVWGCDDPRWAPPTMDEVAKMSLAASLSSISTAAIPICEICEKDQSDDPKFNSCLCYPTLFGCANPSPSPVQVFRTKGRSNGLLALCAFERGALVGEFVGIITKGLQDVDVMEGSQPRRRGSGSTTGAAGGASGLTAGLGSSLLSPSSSTSGAYQIWQGKQGNFTRFVNHSCKANAQYQTFTWLGTQRIVLVSKGIEAGSEITVDYSDKYWKGLDKTCLCGEKSCRYRRDG